MRLCEDFTDGIHRDALPHGGERPDRPGQLAHPLLLGRGGRGQDCGAVEHADRRRGQFPATRAYQGASGSRFPRGYGGRGEPDGRGSEPDRFDCGQPHPVPRARRRQPCVDGLEHDAPGRAPGNIGSPDRRHGYREGYDLRQPHPDCGRGRRRGRFRRRYQDTDQIRAYGRRGIGLVRTGSHDLRTSALPPYEPEYLHHAQARRTDGRQGREGADPDRGLLDATRRAGPGPQPESGVHALEGLQLRGCHRDLGAYPA